MSTVEDMRKELSRLLSSAKDKDRKDLILKAIQSLDDNDMSNEQYRLIHNISPSANASLFMSENMPVIESVTMTPGGSARMRPMSARLRKPSMPNILDAIPEMGKKSSYLNATEELVMPYEEISEVVASSYDGRFPPKNIFKYSASSSSSASNLSSNGTVGFGDLSSAGHVQSGSSPSAASSAFKAYSSSRNSSRSSSPSVNNRRSRSNSINRDDESTTTPPVKLYSSSTTTLSANTAADSINPIRSTPSQHLSSAVHPDPRLGWISTGLVPQFLFVSFYEKWYIKKIEVFCSGIDKLCFQIHSSASSLMKSSGSLSEMARLGSGAFVWYAGGVEDRFDQTVAGLPGIAVTFTVKGTSSIFIRISEIRILVLPYS